MAGCQFPTQSLPQEDLYLDLHIKYWLLSSFEQNKSVLADFSKTPQYKISQKSVQPLSSCYMQTGRRLEKQAW
jgi:hypothetical protein